MTAISMIATAAAALLTPLAASAAPADAAAPAATTLAAARSQAPTRSATPSRPTRYCIVDQITGSRIERRTCQTLETWLAQGIDPRAPR